MHIQPVSLPEISGVDPGNNVRAQVAVAAAVKTLNVQAQVGAELVALLDPNAGKHVNRGA